MEQDRTVRIIVGLGNPGRQYADTRHNVGFEVLAELVRRWQLAGPVNAFGGQVWDARMARGALERRVKLLAPMTYMNRSGQAVQELAAFYKVQPHEVLAVLDDMALPLGRLRARGEGSAGGHNGLDDVLRAMGTAIVPRLRVGIGTRPEVMHGRDFVLSVFGEGEKPVIRQAILLAAEAAEAWVFDGIETVMQKYNAAQDKDSKD